MAIFCTGAGSGAGAGCGSGVGWLGPACARLGTGTVGGGDGGTSRAVAFGGGGTPAVRTGGGRGTSRAAPFWTGAGLGAGAGCAARAGWAGVSGAGMGLGLACGARARAGKAISGIAGSGMDSNSAMIGAEAGAGAGAGAGARAGAGAAGFFTTSLGTNILPHWVQRNFLFRFSAAMVYFLPQSHWARILPASVMASFLRPALRPRPCCGGLGPPAPWRKPVSPPGLPGRFPVLRG